VSRRLMGTQELCYGSNMWQAFVGIVSRQGLEVFCPEHPQTVRFLQRRVERTRGQAVCFWSVAPAKAAVETLEMADQKWNGKIHQYRFFLAMAYWQLGEKDKTRQAYDQGAQWMDQTQASNEEQRRFRAEAAELLGISEPTDARPQ